MRDILFLAHRIPYPPDKGDKIRSWHVLKYLAERARVHLAAFVDAPEDMAHEGFLKELCGEVLLRPLDPTLKLRRAVGGFWRGEALSLSLFHDPAMHDWVRGLLRRQPVDGIFVFSSQMAQYALPHVHGRRSVMDFVDIDSDKWRQYAAGSSGLKRLVYTREARLLSAFEKHVARHVDTSVFVSEAEARLFRRTAGSYGHSVVAMNNGVDLAYFNPTVPLSGVRPAGKPMVVFTGAMDYRPNIEAVTWFVKEVWPLVQAVRPQAGFTIVGSKPSPEVQRLNGQAGIVVTGRVDDVRPYLAGADVVVAPLRIARGIQNKVLEAMAMARPVVATSQAFEGIDADPGTHLFVEDEPQAIAERIVVLADSPALGRSVGHAAREQVVARYDWATSLNLLDTIFDLTTGAEQQRVAMP